MSVIVIVCGCVIFNTMKFICNFFSIAIRFVCNYGLIVFLNCGLLVIIIITTSVCGLVVVIMGLTVCGSLVIVVIIRINVLFHFTLFLFSVGIPNEVWK